MILDKLTHINYMTDLKNISTLDLITELDQRLVSIRQKLKETSDALKELRSLDSTLAFADEPTEAPADEPTEPTEAPADEPTEPTEAPADEPTEPTEAPADRIVTKEEIDRFLLKKFPKSEFCLKLESYSDELRQNHIKTQGNMFYLIEDEEKILKQAGIFAEFSTFKDFVSFMLKDKFRCSDVTDFYVYKHPLWVKKPLSDNYEKNKIYKVLVSGNTIYLVSKY
jgi:hypothetical protein